MISSPKSRSRSRGIKSKSRGSYNVSKPKDENSTTSSKPRSHTSRRNSRKRKIKNEIIDEKPKTETTMIEIKPKKKKQGFLSGLGRLYEFADGVDIQLMIIGIILALVQAALPPFVWLVMGDFVSFAIEREVSDFMKFWLMDEI